jgi:DNA-binding NtrC family response regulator
MQALLLRFLENGEIQPVGADRWQGRVDVRLIAATNRTLEDLVAAGQFRQDLLYRLRVIHLHLPPLRDRREDIPELVRRLTRRLGHDIEFSEAALDLLMRYRWPGNVRELANVLEQACWMLHGARVADVEHLPPALRDERRPAVPARERRRQLAYELYDAVVSGQASFWDHVYPLFLARDLTRHDLRELVKRGLSETRGNYRALLHLFRIPTQDYKRFLNSLAAHGCSIDVRPYRRGTPPPRLIRPPLDLTQLAAASNAAQEPPPPESPAADASHE